MQAPVLIALHAVKRAGKDTMFNFAQEWGTLSDPALTAVRRGFADNAKWAFARQFFPQISLEEGIKWVDEFKDAEHVEFEFPEKFVDGEMDEYTFGTVQFRQCMKQFATESARHIYGGNFWVDQLLPAEPDDRNPEGWHGSFLTPPKTANDDPYSIADICVVADMRFEEEIERVKQLGGLRVKIRRRDAEQAVIEEAAREGRHVHQSDLLLPDDMFDVVIHNNDNNMDYARARMFQVMDEIKKNGIASIKRGHPRPWRIGI